MRLDLVVMRIIKDWILDLSKTEDKTITIKNSNLSRVKLPETCEKLNLVDSRITIV